MVEIYTFLNLDYWSSSMDGVKICMICRHSAKSCCPVVWHCIQLTLVSIGFARDGRDWVQEARDRRCAQEAFASHCSHLAQWGCHQSCFANARALSRSDQGEGGNTVMQAVQCKRAGNVFLFSYLTSKAVALRVYVSAEDTLPCQWQLDAL